MLGDISVPSFQAFRLQLGLIPLALLCLQLAGGGSRDLSASLTLSADSYNVAPLMCILVVLFL